MMEALFYTDTQTVMMREAPTPQPSDNEHLVRVLASGICGSDMHAYHGHDARRVPPMILGHEFCGVVEGGEHDGERVVVNPLRSCGRCGYCSSGRMNLCAERDILGMYRAGAMAQQVAVHDQGMRFLSADSDPVVVSLTEPTATALHAVALVERHAERPVSEHRVLVQGAGAIGVLVALVLLSKGCRSVDMAEPNPLRRNSAERLGGIRSFDPIKDAPEADRYDVVYDCVGMGQTRADASRAVAPGGIISHLGLQDNLPGLDTRKITLQEVMFLGNYCYTDADFTAALALLEAGRLGDLSWVETRPLREGPRAFADIHNGATPAAKIVLLP